MQLFRIINLLQHGILKGRRWESSLTCQLQYHSISMKPLINICLVSDRNAFSSGAFPDRSKLPLCDRWPYRILGVRNMEIGEKPHLARTNPGSMLAVHNISHSQEARPLRHMPASRFLLQEWQSNIVRRWEVYLVIPWRKVANKINRTPGNTMHYLLPPWNQFNAYRQLWSLQFSL